VGSKLLIAAAGLAALLATSAGLAQERHTPDEAKALAERAARHIGEVGPRQAIADFNDPANGYLIGELFPFAYNAEGIAICCYPMRALVGHDAKNFRDSDGKAFGQEIIATANAQGSGWVEYRMTNPQSRKLEDKVSYVIKAGDVIVGVGVYKPSGAR
jgi:cytochrome c